MDFNDIERYISDADHRVDVLVGDVPHQIRKYTTDFGLELTPDFQRGHVWNDRQRTAFVEHLLKGGVGSKEIRFNCPGFPWRSREPGGHMVLVDGLQRVTAITDFTENRLRAFGLYHDQFEGEIPLDLMMSFRVNKLPTRADVLRWYIELNAGGVAHTDADIAKVVDLLNAELGRPHGFIYQRAYVGQTGASAWEEVSREYILERIGGPSLSPMDALERLHTTGNLRSQFVMYRCFARNPAASV